MPFIPHTPDEVRTMLDAIGVPTLDTLFDEIPPALRVGELPALPEALSEGQVSRLLTERAAEPQPLCFLGAGAYEHFIPAAVWDIAGRGEFYSAYTPYQPEASQGTLQVLYEYQSMMAGLTGMAVSNASLYDGASALAEALLMAVRANRIQHGLDIIRGVGNERHGRVHLSGQFATGQRAVFVGIFIDRKGCIGSDIQQARQRCTGSDAQDPPLTVRVFIDQLWSIGQQFIDLDNDPIHRAVDIGSRLHRLDHSATFSRGHRPAYFRQLHEHQITQQVLGMVGDAYNDNAVFLKTHPLVSFGIAQFSGNSATHGQFLDKI